MTVREILLSPLTAFIVVLGGAFLLSWLVSRLSVRPQSRVEEGTLPYACGEENYNHAARPDYSVFFPFAIFFTIAHVAAMVITTFPARTPQSIGLAVLFIAGSATGLYIVMRKQ